MRGNAFHNLHILNEMIKSALPFMSSFITFAFNVILDSGKFPSKWKEGIVIPIHKNGSQVDPNNYRGITLSSCLGKLFCHVLNNRINSELESKSFLKQEQAGFRKNHRTSDHIFILRTIIDKYVLKSKNGSKLFACFIDLKKAFDTVWHDGLFLKLQKAGIGGKVYNVIKSMYNNCHSRVKSRHFLSDSIAITKGVHQGNVLSPLLFNVFINDIGDSFSETDVPNLHSFNISHLLYADDLLLLSTTAEGLQSNINKVQEFCKQWGLSINIDKTKIMIFSKNGKATGDHFQFTVGHSTLEYVNSYKYLGVEISANGRFLLAEKNLSLKASRALFSIKQSIFDSSIKPSAVLRIFDSLVKPIALYGSEIWVGYKACFEKKSLDEMFDTSFKSLNEFDKIFTRFLKYVLGVHSKASNFAVYSELGQFPLIISVITSCINFWIHAVQSSNDSLISKAYWEHFNNQTMKSSWLSFIKNILSELGFSHVWNNQGTFNSASLVKCIKSKLKERFVLYWNKRMASIDGTDKLRTYKLIKQAFELEQYLEIIPDRKQRKSITALRISAHMLQIERGRYIRNKKEERLCTTCNVIDDEIHFLCECSKHKSLRTEMYSNLNMTYEDAISKINRFINLMTSKDEKVIKAVGLFVSSCKISS